MNQPMPERIGRYRILSELGRGAMGVVYRAEDEALGRPVAIKTILAAMDGEEHAGYVARFRQEAKALGGLNHPAIITVYEFGDEVGFAYLAMELLEGRELRDILAGERLGIPAAVEIATQIADGLAFAHSRDVVHRDVKPGNIMVLAGNRAKLMDFGIARVRASDVKTQTGLLLGSPKYMSPEQVLGRPIDGRTDVFSLGVVLHEMLAGVPPFAGVDMHQLMYQVCHGRPSAPSALNPSVTRTLDLIVARALEKEPDARYPDAASMAADLRTSLAEIVPATPPADSPDRTMTMTSAQTVALERTQAIGTATLAMPSPGLHLSTRSDSSAALARLAEPNAEDRRLLSPVAQQPSWPRRFLSDTALMGACGIVAAAILIAWSIA